MIFFYDLQRYALADHLSELFLTHKNPTMKKILSILLPLTIGTASLYAQIGINTDAPQATLDITAKTTDGSKPEGVLTPRLTGNQIQAADAQYTTLQRGMLIYATTATNAPTGKTVNITAEGYYYFDGTVWQKIGTGAYTGSTSVILNGNSFQRAALTGDATATVNSNATTVVGLLGRPLDTTPPQAENILSYNGTSWEPKSLAAQSIPRQIVSATVPGTQRFSTQGNPGIVLSFSNESYDPYSAWNTDTFIVPSNMGGTYTLNMMISSEHVVGGNSPWWVLVNLERSTDNGVTWTQDIFDINSGIQGGDAYNGNSLFWTGNLNVGDRLRVFGNCASTTFNWIRKGNLAITKL